MTNKQAKSNMEKLTKSRRKVRVTDLLHLSSVNDILGDVSKLPGLKRVIVITQSDSGDEIYYNFNARGVIYQLEMMKTRLVNDLLYPDDEEDE